MDWTQPQGTRIAIKHSKTKTNQRKQLLSHPKPLKHQNSEVQSSPSKLDHFSRSLPVGTPHESQRENPNLRLGIIGLQRLAPQPKEDHEELEKADDDGESDEEEDEPMYLQAPCRGGSIVSCFEDQMYPVLVAHRPESYSVSMRRLSCAFPLPRPSKDNHITKCLRCRYPDAACLSTARRADAEPKTTWDFKGAPNVDPQ